MTWKKDITMLENYRIGESSAIDSNYNTRLNGGPCGSLKRKTEENSHDQQPPKLPSNETDTRGYDSSAVEGITISTNSCANGAATSRTVGNPDGDWGNCDGACPFQPKAITSECRSTVSDAHVVDIKPSNGSRDIMHDSDGLKCSQDPSGNLPVVSTNAPSAHPSKKPLKLHRCRICSKIFASATFLSKHFAQTHSKETNKQTLNAAEHANNVPMHKFKMAEHQVYESKQQFEKNGQQLTGNQLQFKESLVQGVQLKNEAPESPVAVEQFKASQRQMEDSEGTVKEDQFKECRRPIKMEDHSKDIEEPAVSPIIQTICDPKQKAVTGDIGVSIKQKLKNKLLEKKANIENKLGSDKMPKTEERKVSQPMRVDKVSKPINVGKVSKPTRMDKVSKPINVDELMMVKRTQENVPGCTDVVYRCGKCGQRFHTFARLKCHAKNFFCREFYSVGSREQLAAKLPTSAMSSERLPGKVVLRQTCGPPPLVRHPGGWVYGRINYSTKLDKQREPVVVLIDCMKKGSLKMEKKQEDTGTSNSTDLLAQIKPEDNNKKRKMATKD